VHLVTLRRWHFAHSTSRASLHIKQSIPSTGCPIVAWCASRRHAPPVHPVLEMHYPSWHFAHSTSPSTGCPIVAWCASRRHAPPVHPVLEINYPTPPPFTSREGQKPAFLRADCLSSFIVWPCQGCCAWPSATRKERSPLTDGQKTFHP